MFKNIIKIINKSFLKSIVLFIFFTSIIWYISFTFILEDYKKLELDKNFQNIESLLLKIDNDIKNIKNITNDYSKWDETYEFIQTEKKEYIYDNFREGTNTLEDLDIDFIIFVNLNKKVVFSKYTNSNQLDNYVLFEEYILESLKNYNSFNSLSKYNSLPLYLIKSEILRSDGTGDLKGFIISGKFIKNSMFNSFKRIFINLEISLNNKNNKYPEKKDFKFINDFYIQTKIDENINNYISFFDKDKYLFSINTINYKDIIKKGEQTIFNYNLVVSAILFIIFFNMYINQNKLQAKINKKTNELRKSHEELEKKVVERTIELKELNENLETIVQKEIKKQQEQEQLLIQQSRLASLGEMIGNIAHQWRQPLNALSLTIQNIKFAYEINELNEEFMNKSINKVNMLTQEMSKTIDDFKDFFKPNKKKKRFFLNTSIDKTLKIIEGCFDNNNINFEIKSNSKIEVYGFDNEYSQVILNILNNAKDALIKNKIKKPKIKIEITKDNKYGIVSIKDNAGGINKNILEKIFDPYFTTKEEGEGTGIGLYMSKTIIEKNMKGKLYVINNRNGANFIVKIPLKNYNKYS